MPVSLDVPEYDVRGKRGDFEPLISEDLFYRLQAILSGRLPSTTPKQRAHPDFPLTGTAGCCGVNVTKATLEGLFADELWRRGGYGSK